MSMSEEKYLVFLVMAMGRDQLICSYPDSCDVQHLLMDAIAAVVRPRASFCFAWHENLDAIL